MKTEVNPSNDPIWTNSVELLPQEECLPVIGSCQVSSILSNLDSGVHTEEVPQNLDVIVLPASSDYKPFNLQNNYIVLKENKIVKPLEKIKPIDTEKLKDSKLESSDFEKMLYFVCNLCPFLCTKDEKIKEHLENAHKNKLVRKLVDLKCPACANIFYHKVSLRSHLIHDHGVSNSDLNKIIQTVVYHANKDKVKAKKVEVEEKVEVRLENDDDDSSSPEEALTEFKPGIPLLEENVNNSQDLEKVKLYNLMKNEAKKPCSFTSCKVTLQDPTKLTYHINCHTDSGFVCLECNENFSFWKPLTGHLWRFHKIDMELYACDKCDYKTFSLAKLNNMHKLIHGDVRAFSCDQCPKAFKNAKQLRNHKLTHKTKLCKVSYSCEVCLKQYSDKRQLKVHKDVVHFKIKPFLCNYCGYTGPTRSSLKMHIRQHTGEKPFECDVCPYKSSDHNSLRRHKLRHTGQKPYKCSYCSYACIQSSTYKVHLKTKHPGMEKNLMYTCPSCQYRSVNKDMFNSHMITVHKQKPDSLAE